MKILSIVLLFGFWVASSVSVVAQQVSLTPEENHWLSLVLAMAAADPELREQTATFQSLSATQQQQRLQQVKALVHTFNAARSLKAARQSSSIILHPRVYVDDDGFLRNAFKKLTELEYDPADQAIQLRFQYMFAPKGTYVASLDLATVL